MKCYLYILMFENLACLSLGLIGHFGLLKDVNIYFFLSFFLGIKRYLRVLMFENLVCSRCIVEASEDTSWGCRQFGLSVG